MIYDLPSPTRYCFNQSEERLRSVDKKFYNTAHFSKQRSYLREKLYLITAKGNWSVEWKNTQVNRGKRACLEKRLFNSIC